MFRVEIHITFKPGWKKKVTFGACMFVNKSASKALMSSSESEKKSEPHVDYVITYHVITLKPTYFKLI